jgi:hypothetical protein
MEKMPYGFWWRKKFLTDITLPYGAKLVGLVLNYHMDNDTCECFPSIETIAFEASLSPRAVKKHLKILVQADWIWIEKRPASNGYQRNYYTGVFPGEDRSKYR